MTSARSGRRRPGGALEGPFPGCLARSKCPLAWVEHLFFSRKETILTGSLVPGTIPAPRKEWLRAGVPSGSAAGSPQALVRRARGPAPSFSAGTAIFQVGPARGSRRPACHRRERQRGGRGGRALGFWRDCPVCFGPAGLGGGAMSVRGGLGPGPRGRRPGSDAAALLWGHAAEAPGRDTCFCDVFGVVS